MRYLALICLTIGACLCATAQTDPVATLIQEYSRAVDGGHLDRAAALYNNLTGKPATEAQRRQIEEIHRRQTRKEAQRREDERFYSVPDYISAPAEGGVTETRIHGAHWSVDYTPSYISAEKKGDMLIADFSANTTGSYRDGSIDIRMKGVVYSIAFQQAPQQMHPLIKVTPTDASVRIDGTEVIARGKPIGIQTTVGQHTVTATHELYHDATVSAYLSPGRPLEIKLRPAYGIVRMEWPEDMERMPVVTIGDKRVSTTGAVPMPHGSAPIPFRLYKGDSIVVPEGRYKVKVESAELLPLTREIAVSAGSTQSLEPQLRKGHVLLTFGAENNSDATGIAVYDGDRYLGEPSREHNSMRMEAQLKCGTHKLTFRKPDYRLFSAEWNGRDIMNGDTAVLDVSDNLTAHVEVRFLPAGFIRLKGQSRSVAVKIDGREPLAEDAAAMLYYVRPGENHTVEVSQDGCWPRTFTCRVPAAGDTVTLDYGELEHLHPLLLEPDDSDYLSLDLSRNGEHMTTGKAGTFQLPYGRYRLKAYSGNSTVYRGYINHRPGVERHTFNRYSHDYFQILEAAYNLTSAGYRAYRPMGDAQLCSFYLLPGITTALADVTFLQRGQLPGAGGSRYMMGLSCLIINEQLRIGGSVLPWLDVSALGRYSWCPPIRSFFPISHFDGHNIFYGVELSSRLHYVDASLRIGMQLMRGNSNFKRSADDPGVGKFLKQGLNTTTFTVALGVSLGTFDSKGKNILRVF